MTINFISVFFIFITVVVIVLIVLNKLLSVHIIDSQKLSYYECGFESFFLMNRTPIAIIYYIVAIIFMIFDLEIMFIYPFIASFYYINIYGF